MPPQIRAETARICAVKSAGIMGAKFSQTPLRVIISPHTSRQLANPKASALMVKILAGKQALEEYARKAGMRDSHGMPYDTKQYHTAMCSFEAARRIK